MLFFTETLFRVEEHFQCDRCGCRPAHDTILQGASLPFLATLRVHCAYCMEAGKQFLPWVLNRFSCLYSLIGNFCLFSCFECWHITNWMSFANCCLRRCLQKEPFWGTEGKCLIRLHSLFPCQRRTECYCPGLHWLRRSCCGCSGSEV